jgi:hypothetical protein
MKRSTFLSFVAISLPFVMLHRASNSEASKLDNEQTVTPVNSEFRTFPDSLYCDQVDAALKGPTWNNITIGISSFTDLEKNLNTLDDYRTINRDNRDIILSPKILNQPNRPIITEVCIYENVIVALKTNMYGSPYLKLEDLVIDYGAPNAVTWAVGDAALRVAFWFQQGLAAVANSDPDYGTVGQIVEIIYFPYQEIRGYEKRWPYDRTRSLTFPEGLDTPSGKQNPFDFDSMVQTVTAQPSRTPTSSVKARPSKTPAPSR